MKREMRSGKHIKSVLFSVFREEESRKSRNMVLKHEKHVNVNVQLEKEKMTKYCSCDVEWNEDDILNAGIWK